MYFVFKYKAVLIIQLWHDGNYQITKDLGKNISRASSLQTFVVESIFRTKNPLPYEQDERFLCLTERATAVQGDKVMLVDCADAAVVIVYAEWTQTLCGSQSSPHILSCDYYNLCVKVSGLSY